MNYKSNNVIDIFFLEQPLSASYCYLKRCRRRRPQVNYLSIYLSIFLSIYLSIYLSRCLLNFMYHGEVQVAQDNIQSFLRTAETLQVNSFNFSFILSFSLTFILTFILSFIISFLHCSFLSLLRTSDTFQINYCLHSFSHSLFISFFIHPFINPFIHPFIIAFIHAFIHS